MMMMTTTNIQLLQRTLPNPSPGLIKMESAFRPGNSALVTLPSHMPVEVSLPPSTFAGARWSCHPRSLSCAKKILPSTNPIRNKNWRGISSTSPRLWEWSYCSIMHLPIRTLRCTWFPRLHWLTLSITGDEKWQAKSPTSKFVGRRLGPTVPSCSNGHTIKNMVVISITTSRTIHSVVITMHGSRTIPSMSWNVRANWPLTTSPCVTFARGMRSCSTMVHFGTTHGRNSRVDIPTLVLGTSVMLLVSPTVFIRRIGFM
mmetsp:Transcript_30224/g.55820  ORF Transcript_30224/g.55820 Transcript_30224/m.55820 type:complete len:258 (+) Transcript_30224:2-775(+)